ncbi:MAG: energy transducer TonB [Candidatus Omnitrophota bacterium]
MEPRADIFFIGAILQDEAVSPDNRLSEIKPSPGIEKINKNIPAFGILSAEDENHSYLEKPVFMTDFDALEELSDKAGSADKLTGAKQFAQRFFDDVKVSYKALPFEIKGPVKFREIIYRPDLPDNLRWDEGLGVDLNRLGNSFEMELKFWVSAEGNVEMIERISSSGHPTIDLTGMRYLKGWRFAPLTSVKKNDEQWGVVKLTLNLVKVAVE